MAEQVEWTPLPTALTGRPHNGGRVPDLRINIFRSDWEVWGGKITIRLELGLDDPVAIYLRTYEAYAGWGTPPARFRRWVKRMFRRMVPAKGAL